MTPHNDIPLQENTAERDNKVKQTMLRDIVGYNMKRAFMLIHEDYKLNTDAIGLSQRHFTALTLIVENPDMSQSDLARALSVERPAVVLIVDELENPGIDHPQQGAAGPPHLCLAGDPQGAPPVREEPESHPHPRRPPSR